MEDQPKQINLEKDINLVLSPPHLNVVLRGLEKLELGLARATFQEIERQVVAQVQPAKVPAASKRVK